MLSLQPDVLTPKAAPAVALRIIIADDEHSITTIIERMITRTYPSSMILTATNGKEALHMYEQHGADLLVTDHHMPEMDGFELISAIRAHDVIIPILLISSIVDSTVHITAVDRTHFLRKPFTLRQLVEALTILLTGSLSGRL